MPELPDVAVYVERLDALFSGSVLSKVRVVSPFLLRSVSPPLSAASGRRILAFERQGKKIVFVLEGDLFLVLHLMIAGRLKLAPPGGKVPGKVGLAAFDTAERTLLLTEASPKKRAWLRVAEGRAALAALDPGGLEPLTTNAESFAAALRRENHTLKRVLTDPHAFAGIGNAYSDEILHRARLSPLKTTATLADAEAARLFAATRAVLTEWTDRLRAEAGDGFPVKVTAFREGMAVHGRHGLPCPDCGAPVQRIVHAENETNYCAACQTGGKLLADRALSRLLKSDWPRTLEEMEEGIAQRREVTPPGGR